MATLKKGFSTPYTQIPHTILNDKTLSLKAKGMYAFMLSKPDWWEFSIGGLASQLKEARDGCRTPILELEDARYLHRKQITDEKGLFLKNEYTIYAEPQPLTDFPTTDNPTTDFPTTDSPTVINNKQSNNKSSNNKSSSKKLIKKEIYHQIKSNKKLILTIEEFDKLIDLGYNKTQIDDTIEKVENYKKNRNYNSLFLTLKNWLKPKEQKSKTSAIDNLNSLIHGL